MDKCRKLKWEKGENKMKASNSFTAKGVGAWCVCGGESLKKKTAEMLKVSGFCSSIKYDQMIYAST